jgi:hypothetical protein
VSGVADRKYCVIGKVLLCFKNTGGPSGAHLSPFLWISLSRILFSSPSVVVMLMMQMLMLLMLLADVADADDDGVDVDVADVDAAAVITISPSFKLEPTTTWRAGRLCVHLRFTTSACA